MKKNNSKIVFLALLIFSSRIFSQRQCEQLKFKNYGSEQGLAVITAFAMVQDDNGFL